MRRKRRRSGGSLLCSLLPYLLHYLLPSLLFSHALFKLSGYRGGSTAQITVRGMTRRDARRIPSGQHGVDRSPAPLPDYGFAGRTRKHHVPKA